MKFQSLGLGISQTSALNNAGEHIHILMARSGDGWRVTASTPTNKTEFSKAACSRYEAAEEAIDRLCY